MHPLSHTTVIAAAALLACTPDVLAVGGAGGVGTSTGANTSTQTTTASNSVSATGSTAPGRPTCPEDLKCDPRVTTGCVDSCALDDPCDCDGDGFVRPGAGCADLVTPDCYDCNALVKPTQMNYFSEHRGDGSFDFDCNGTADLAYPDTCSQAMPCSGQAFMSEPKCGQVGELFECSMDAFACVKSGTPSATAQVCR